MSKTMNKDKLQALANELAKDLKKPSGFKRPQCSTD